MVTEITRDSMLSTASSSNLLRFSLCWDAQFILPYITGSLEVSVHEFCPGTYNQEDSSHQVSHHFIDTFNQKISEGSVKFIFFMTQFT